MVRAGSVAERTGSAATSAVSGVATKPGTIVLQHTPRGAQASDWDLVSPASPALAAPYPPLLPKARTACCEAMLRIRPQPRPAITGPNRWPSRNGAVRLTAIRVSQSAVVSSPSGGRGVEPAPRGPLSG